MTPADEAFLASALAQPEWPRLRRLLAEAGCPVEALDVIIARVRLELWKDHSGAPRA